MAIHIVKCVEERSLLNGRAQLQAVCVQLGNSLKGFLPKKSGGLFSPPLSKGRDTRRREGRGVSGVSTVSWQ